jgi:autotransporter-associated beta strand protein
MQHNRTSLMMPAKAMRLAILVVFAYIEFAQSAFAADRLWTGASGNSFHGQNNWSPTSVPGPSDLAIFGPGSPNHLNNIHLSQGEFVDGLRFRDTSQNIRLTESGLRFVQVGDDGIVLGANYNGTATIDPAVVLRDSQTWDIAHQNGSLIIARELNLDSKSLTVKGSGKVEINGTIITGTGSLTKNEGGLLVLQGAPNGNFGTTTVNSGSLILNKSHSANPLNFGKAVSTLVVNTGANASIADHGQIRDDASVSLTGATLNFNSFDDTVGPLTINSSTISGTTNGPNPSTLGRLNSDAARTITSSGSSYINTTRMFAEGNVPIDVQSGILQISSQLYDFSTPMSITKSGAGTLTLTGVSTNTFSGTTVINGGGLRLSKPEGTVSDSYGPAVGNLTSNFATVFLDQSSQIRDSANVILIGSYMNLHSYSERVYALTLDSSHVIGSGTSTWLAGSGNSISSSGTSTMSQAYLTIESEVPIIVANGTLTVSSAINNWNFAGTLKKEGAGALVLNGSNTYSGGTVVNGGTISGRTETIQGPLSIANLAHVNFNQGHTGNINYPISGQGSLSVTGGGRITFSAASPSWSGGLGITTSTVFGNGATIGTGTLTMDGALFELSSGATVTNPVSLTTNSAINTGYDVTFSGNFTGVGGLSKLGGGAVRMTGVNTYTGGTFIDDGKLIVDGSLRGLITPRSTGILSGTGSIIGNVNNDGRVAPGNSPGILTINGNYSQTNEGTLEIEFGGLTPGSFGHDQLVVTGTANLNGRLEVSLVDLGNGYVPTPGDTITVLTAGTRTGSFTKPVAPNLPAFNATHDPDIAFQAAYIGNTLEIRVIQKDPNEIAFDSVFENTFWSDDDTWTGSGLPNEKHDIVIDNQFGSSAQNVVVDVAEAIVSELTVSDSFAPITLTIQNNRVLTAQTDMVVGTHGKVMVENTGTLNTGTLTLENGALLGGTGIVLTDELTVNQGIISPGFSVGHLDIVGDVVLTESSSVVMEISGTDSGQYDTLRVTQDASLDGTLRLAVSNNSTPAGQSFEIISTGEIIDTKFDNLVVEGISGVFFGLEYSDLIVSLVTFNTGNMNRSGPEEADEDDIPAFALALTNPAKYFNDFGASSDNAGDIDGDGDCDVDDIDDFKNLLPSISLAEFQYRMANALSVPEPSGLQLGFMLALCLRCRLWGFR